jgi:hypothetical protein
VSSLSFKTQVLEHFGGVWSVRWTIELADVLVGATVVATGESRRTSKRKAVRAELRLRRACEDLGWDRA